MATFSSEQRIPEDIQRAVAGAPEPLRIVVVGRPDTGKSTLALQLARWLAEQGRRCAFLDCDVGQADIGPPGFVSYGIVRKTGEGGGVGSKSEEPDVILDPDYAIRRLGSYLVGDVSPYGGGEGKLLAMVAGARACLDWAERDGADAVVVDTTGLAAFSEGVRLKCAKMDVLGPAIVVLFRSSEENEPVENAVGDVLRSLGFTVLDFESSPGVRRRTPEERRTNRVRRWNLYLDRSSFHAVDRGGTRFLRWWADPGFSHPTRSRVEVVPHGTVVALPDPVRRGLHVPGIWVTGLEGSGVLADLSVECEIETVWVTSYQILMSKGRAMSA